MWDYDGLKSFVLQYLHNRHRPDLGLWGGHVVPGGASSQDAEVPSDHPSGQPTEQGAIPAPNIEACDEKNKIMDMSITAILKLRLTPSNIP